MGAAVDRIDQLALSPGELMEWYARTSFPLECETKKNVTVLVRGVLKNFDPYRNKKYGKYYYADLHNEDGGRDTIGIRIPEELSARLVNDKVYVFMGYSYLNVRNGNLRVMFTAQSCVDSENIVIEKKVSSVEAGKHVYIPTNPDDPVMKAIRDLLAARKDHIPSFAESVLKQLHEEGEARILVVKGHSSIVLEDVKSMMPQYYGKQIRFVLYDVQLTAKAIGEEVYSIYDKAAEHRVAAVAVIRGGGDGVELSEFDDGFVAFSFLDYFGKDGYPCPIVTAIGHGVNTTLLDRVADLSFSVPAHLGMELRKICEIYLEEIELNRKKDKLEAMKNELRGELEKLEQVDKLRQEVDKLEREIQRKHGYIARLNDRIADLEGRVERIPPFMERFLRSPAALAAGAAGILLFGMIVGAIVG